MGEMYECWWTVRLDINVYPRFEYHLFYVLYAFVTYLFAVPRMKMDLRDTG
jgi:hypothetical protein